MSAHTRRPTFVQKPSVGVSGALLLWFYRYIWIALAHSSSKVSNFFRLPSGIWSKKVWPFFLDTSANGLLAFNSLAILEKTGWNQRMKGNLPSTRFLSPRALPMWYDTETGHSQISGRSTICWKAPWSSPFFSHAQAATSHERLYRLL